MQVNACINQGRSKRACSLLTAGVPSVKEKTVIPDSHRHAALPLRLYHVPLLCSHGSLALHPYGRQQVTTNGQGTHPVTTRRRGARWLIRRPLPKERPPTT